MKITVDSIGFADGLVTFSIPPRLAEDVLKLLEKARAGRKLDIEVKPHYNKRSLNANAALWAMLGEMAVALGTTAEELYLVELERYGESRFMAICPEDLAKETACHRVVRPRGDVYINGYRFISLQVWDGSSGYNTAQFARLLDGVIEDAKEIGVDYISGADRAAMLAEMEQEKILEQQRQLP